MQPHSGGRIGRRNQLPPRYALLAAVAVALASGGGCVSKDQVHLAKPSPLRARCYPDCVAALDPDCHGYRETCWVPMNQHCAACPLPGSGVLMEPVAAPRPDLPAPLPDKDVMFEPGVRQAPGASRARQLSRVAHHSRDEALEMEGEAWLDQVDDGDDGVEFDDDRREAELAPVDDDVEWDVTESDELDLDDADAPWPDEENEQSPQPPPGSEPSFRLRR